MRPIGGRGGRIAYHSKGDLFPLFLYPIFARGHSSGGGAGSPLRRLCGCPASVPFAAGSLRSRPPSAAFRPSAAGCAAAVAVCGRRAQSSLPPLSVARGLAAPGVFERGGGAGGGSIRSIRLSHFLRRHVRRRKFLSARKRASGASALRRAAAFSNESPTQWVSFESVSKILF